MEFSNDMLLLRYDEIIRCYDILVDSTNLEKTFLRFLPCLEEIREKWIEATDECRRLKAKLDSANKDIEVSDKKLLSARRWLDAERQLRKRLETERDMHCRQLNEIRNILVNDSCVKIPYQMRERLVSLSEVSDEPHRRPAVGLDRLNTIAESDSMSNLSDVSVSRSGDDLDDIPMSRSGMKHRQSLIDDEPSAVKKRRSSCVLTSVLASAPSVNLGEELLPQDDEYDHQSKRTKLSAVDRINARAHSFIQKTFIMPETCASCSKKIGFGRMVSKCMECNSVVHPECVDKVPLPCIPMGVSPKRATAGLISDYAPSTFPRIPSIVIYCINEVERRGLNEIGIYRMSGTDAVIRGLREKFAKGKGVPCLSDVDIHSVCCFLKDFLRNLQDPLIPQIKWRQFSEAVEGNKSEDELISVVSMLPRANRDTLAYLILHLKKVAASPPCQMSIQNLSKVFGPTVVGYSNDDHLSPLNEAHIANLIMEKLLSLPEDCWNNFINSSTPEPKTPCNSYTPQTVDCSNRKTARKLATSSAAKRKFFTSPPLQ